MQNIIIGAFLAATMLGAPLANAGKPAGGSTTASYAGQSIPLLPGDNQSQGFGVSDSGSVAGTGWGAGGSRAFYWHRATGVLYQLTSTGATGYAHAIAGGGQGRTEYAVGEEKTSSDRQRAVIWIAPPTQGPGVLDHDPVMGSVAFGVNANGVAVGVRGSIPAIWAPGANGYVRTDIAILPNQQSAYAEDIGDDGIVVGYGEDATTYRRLAFIRLLDGKVVAILPESGDVESAAYAVSNILGTGGNQYVYVAGLTVSSSSVERAVRLKVRVSDGYVVERTVLNQTWAEGVNNGGDMAGTINSLRGQSASLWRGGVYFGLNAPKGGTNCAVRGLARNATSTTYVTGVTMINNWPRAAVWEVK
jgi:hypothetical protein